MSHKFHTPPQNQGQIVTESYACNSNTIFCRRYDASDRTTTYYVADVADVPEADAGWHDDYDPAQDVPPPALYWRSIDEVNVLYMLAD